MWTTNKFGLLSWYLNLKQPYKNQVKDNRQKWDRDYKFGNKDH